MLPKAGQFPPFSSAPVLDNTIILGLDASLPDRVSTFTNSVSSSLEELDSLV